MRNLTKERKQPPAIILEQPIFCNIFILRLWLRIIRRSDSIQKEKFQNFPCETFFLYVYLSTLDPRNLPCLEKFLAARLQKPVKPIILVLYSRALQKGALSQLLKQMRQYGNKIVGSSGGAEVLGARRTDLSLRPPSSSGFSKLLA